MLMSGYMVNRASWKYCPYPRVQFFGGRLFESTGKDAIRDVRRGLESEPSGCFGHIRPETIVVVRKRSVLLNNILQRCLGLRYRDLGWVDCDVMAMPATPWIKTGSV